MFGGVYGTVLASALLAALQQSGGTYTPYYDAAWLAVTAVTSALAHGYAHHMSTHTPGSGGHRWRRLGHALLDEWPLVGATLPTVGLLLAAGAAGWAEENVTLAGLALNSVLLFGWGTFAALRVGYRGRSAVAIGSADAAIGLAIAVANSLIK